MHLQLVHRLLISDIGLSSCIFLHFFVKLFLNLDQLRSFCKIYVPCVVYFFIVSYGWTVTLSMRFLLSRLSELKQDGTPPIPYRWVWLAPFFLSATDLIASWVWGDVTTVVESSGNHFLNQSCTFNHNRLHGVVLDIVTFQLPMVLAAIVNVIFCVKTILSLHNAPQSVVARHLRKASGYVGVLLAVVVPNVAYNFFAIFDESRNHSMLLNFSVTLASLQGFLNVCAYVWSDNKLRQWLRTHHFFFRFKGQVTIDKQPHDNQEDIAASNSSDDEQTVRVSNPIVDHHFSQARDSIAVKEKSKNIIIPSSLLKEQQKPAQSVAISVDLDRERFVRFGE